MNKLILTIFCISISLQAAQEQKTHASPCNTLQSALLSLSSSSSLPKNVPTLADYEHYLALQKIYAIADQVAREARAYNVSLGIENKDWRNPHPYHCQTKQGFILEVRCDRPYNLYTPWGKINLYDTVDIGNGCIARVLQEFLKHFDWKFLTMIEDSTVAKFSELTTDRGTILLSRDEVRSKEGSKTTIVADDWGYSFLYNLLSVNGSPLPKFINAAYDQYRSYEDVKTIWKAMENKYQQTSSSFSSSSSSSSAQVEPAMVATKSTLVAFCKRLVRMIQK